MDFTFLEGILERVEDMRFEGLQRIVCHFKVGDGGEVKLAYSGIEGPVLTIGKCYEIRLCLVV